MFQKKISIIILCAFLLNLIYLPGQASAWLSVVPTAATAGTTGAGTGGIFAQLGKDMSDTMKANLNATIVTTAKVAALLVVRDATQRVIGKGGNAGIVSDWKQYLYVSPQQRALLQMNSFFNTVSRGRASVLNYEGVGPNHYAYLQKQALAQIKGQPFVTDLPEYVSDPNDLFVTGNMMGILKFMECGNNPACHSMVSVEQYNKFVAQEKEISMAETKDGFLPVKKKGKIFQPSAIVASALTQIDKLGTDVIMNAESKDLTTTSSALYQIGQGAVISASARMLNYALADKDDKEKIRDKNDEFPFSLNYSLNSGIGISAGGVTVGTGMGAIDAQTMIGNTCATTAAKIDSNGNTYVEIQGQKRYCSTGATGSGQGLDIKPSLPAFHCVPGSAGDRICSAEFGTGFRCGSDSRCFK